ncbi:MAG: PKD domain-containing protein [Balneola sp.]|nr:MAG: PKD domain-containing protein [Balneola sp.]
MKRLVLSALFIFLAVSLAFATEECTFAPTANITNTPTGLTFRSGDQIQFSGTTSTPNNCSGYITTYQWTIEGSTYNGSTKTHTFTLPANVHEQSYTVSLKVWNNIGLTNTKSISVTVKRPQRIYHIADHLGSVRTSVDVDGNVVGYDDYYPFGKVMPGRSDNTSNPEDDTKYTGYEVDDEAGLEMYHANARGYDPVIGRFAQIDPLSSRREWVTPYNYVQNNPMLRVDPDGLTDYIIDYKTGKLVRVGDINDEPDRILHSDKEGNVKRKGDSKLFGWMVRKSQKGKPKVAIDNIADGIVEEGMNFRDDDNIIAVGGDGPTAEQVEEFALALSEHVNKEIGGAYFSETEGGETSHITLGRYRNNLKHHAQGYGASKGYGLLNTGLFHTHIDYSLSLADRLSPSGPDFNERDGELDKNPNLQFYILTRDRKNGSRLPRFPYTTIPRTTY